MTAASRGPEQPAAPLAATAPLTTAAGPVGGASVPRDGRIDRRQLMAALPTLPFFAYVAVFLFVPTVIVAVGAFQDPDGGFSLDAVAALGAPSVLAAFGQSVALSAVTALVGAVLGGVLAYALSTGSANSVLRRFVAAVCSVLAQFGGVMLAFAFIATVGSAGLVTNLLRAVAGIESSGGWLYEFPGLVLVYSYFQIPLMVLVFLPAVDGLRPQWREAAETLGASTWVYWRRIAGPLLMPAFLGATLLLFANAFSAYATAAALITQYDTLVTLQIRGALISDLTGDEANLAKSLALGMVVVVAIVMGLYAWLSRRTARWLG